ncbi:hypothetical protein EYF80_028253 [Liparis tanakae]|uniref:Uncharacterized protein n=1 Tax=Liparis tanakae TaxID=230148 RepID=A0A4Z2H6I0_9TELE|nr:hypothetical protein EYF80_028253 [Liparis tanakae]
MEEPPMPPMEVIFQPSMAMVQATKIQPKTVIRKPQIWTTRIFIFDAPGESTSSLDVRRAPLTRVPDHPQSTGVLTETGTRPPAQPLVVGKVDRPLTVFLVLLRPDTNAAAPGYEYSALKRDNNNKKDNK